MTTPSSPRFRTVLAGVLAGALLAGGALAQTPATKLNRVEPDRGFSRVWRDFRDMNQEFARDGTPRTAAQMRAIALGDSKADLVRNAGQPTSASRDGSWNFNVKLPLPQRNWLVCQYKVYFDKDSRVSETVWRRPQCAGLVVGNRGG